MRRFLITLLLCSMPFAYAECLPPTKTLISIKQIANSTDSQTIYFGAYSIKLPSTKEIVFSKDAMILLYEKNDDVRKYIAFQSVENPIEDNSYTVKEAFLSAFGLAQSKQGSEEIIELMRQGFGLCNGKITQYQIKDMLQLVVRFDKIILDDPISYIYIFDKNHDLIDMLVFNKVSNHEIENTLATLSERKK